MTWLARLFGQGADRREASPEPSAPPPAPPAPFPVIAIGEAPFVAPPTLTDKDMAKLQGVHPDLIRVVKRARGMAHFFVAEGLRTPERQAELVKAGASKTLASRHLTGHAVDLYPVSDVPIPKMTRADFLPVVEAMKKAAAIEGVPMNHGHDWGWDSPHHELAKGTYPG